jgi:hypothetical protein
MELIKIDTQNQLQMLAYELIANTNSSFFLTGRAGTGKTTFLRNVQKIVDKQFITLAPTGVAAILAGGDTIHSFFGLPMEVCVPRTCGKLNELRIQTIIHADTIIIDEVSMVRCDIVDAIDYTLRKALRSTQPFGGKQIIFVGDMFQLPPVVRKGAERDLLGDIYKNGIVLTGGGSKLTGPDKLIEKTTGIRTYLAKDPISCVARGTGKSIENLDGGALAFLSSFGNS